MKRQSLVTMLLILALLSMATPATAAPKEPVGDRIGVYYGGSMEFPAGAPFHILHGWILSSAGDANGIYDFELEVDGVPRKKDFKMFWIESGDPDILQRRWVHNFPNGMTGTHTFTGHWFSPCQPAVDNGIYPGPCATPNEKVETLTQTLTVTFVP